VLIVVFRSTGTTTERMAETVDAQLTAAYFVQDVQSIGVRDWSIAPAYPHKPSIELNKPANGGRYPCGTGTTTALFRFAWENPLGDVAPTEPRVSYVVRTVGTERQLHRVACDGNGTVTADITLAHFVDAATSPSVICRGPTGATVTCETTPVPITVELTLTLRAPSSSAPYTMTIVGQRRQQ
jgi:hypothetical protein